METANFGFLLKDYDITVCGKVWYGKLDYTYLCMDADTLSFKKGDRIRLRFILMPWGTYQSESDENVVAVYENSVLNPLTVTSGTNPVSMDDFLPRVTAVDNSATFTVSGSRNNNVVRIGGFTSMKAPLIDGFPPTAPQMSSTVRIRTTAARSNTIRTGPTASPSYLKRTGQT